MISISEINRRMKNIIVTAKVDSVKSSSGKMLARVLYTDTITGEEHLSDFLPVMSKNNSMMKIWMPIRPGEQVTVFRPFGNNDGGIIFASLYWTGNKESVEANEHTAIVEFSDGCIIKYDTKEGSLTVNGTKKIKLVATENITLIAKSLTFKGASLTHNGVNVGWTHIHPTCVKCGGAA